MKNLVQVLNEIAKGSPREGCYILVEGQDEKYMSLSKFIDIHTKDNLKNFEVSQCNHNDLMMQWEIRVKEINNVSK